jgi:hypothetical protein
VASLMLAHPRVVAAVTADNAPCRERLAGCSLALQAGLELSLPSTPMILGQYTPHSGLGNKMTQFASLFSLAEDTRSAILIPSIQGFPLTDMAKKSLPSKNQSLDCEAIQIPGRHTVTVQEASYLENIFNFCRHRDALASIFQLPSFPLRDYRFYQGPRDRLKPAHIDSIRPDDLMISLRLGDFVSKPDADEKWQKCVYSRFLGFSYFRLVLEQVRFGRLFITSDEPFHALTEEFDGFNPIRVQNENPTKTMALVRRFGRIAISESTFSWWASYLSDAEEIFFPISTSGLWGINETWDKASASWKPLNPVNVRDADLYLRVDEDRYRYVHQASGIIYRYRDAPGKRSEDEFERLSAEDRMAGASNVGASGT